MNLLHLHYFYHVAKEGGFTKASTSLRIQQPAISRMVKLLESDIGFSLFERVKVSYRSFRSLKFDSSIESESTEERVSDFLDKRYQSVIQTFICGL